MGNEITRRAALKAAPAVAALAVPAVALGDDPNRLLEAVAGESEIARRFARIERMKADLDAYLDTCDSGDPAVDVACTLGNAEINAVATRMMEIEPETPADLAMQVAFWQGENVDPGDDAGEHGASRETMRARIRRLAGLPIDGVETAVPTATAAAGETEIERLFRRWEAFGRDDAIDPFDESDDGVCGVEARIAALPATNAREFAMKMIVWTLYGADVVGHDISQVMIAEMCSLADATWPWSIREPA